MRTSTITSLSALAIAAVAVVGGPYATAATSPTATAPDSASTAPGSLLQRASSGGALRQIAAARPNIAYLYSTDDTSGTGVVDYEIPNPPNGLYHASFTANFYPQGTSRSPVTFSCYLLKNGQLRAQSTVSTTAGSGFYAGVNGANSVKVSPGDSFDVQCGSDGNDTWFFGSRSLQVSMTRIDGLVNVGLGKGTQKAGSQVAPTR